MYKVMKQEHTELFIDLLVGKIKESEKQISILTKCTEELQSEVLKREEKDAFRPIENTYHVEGRGEVSEDGIQAVINEYENTIKKQQSVIETLQKDNVVLGEELQEFLALKKEKKALNAANTMYSLQVAYARAKGFQFVRAEKMKEFIEQQKECEGKTKTANAAVSENRSEGCNEITFSKSLVQKCPNGFHDRSGNVVYLASQFCRKKCPYIDHIDDDQEVVYCKFPK